jgi:hypothetical protein
MMEYLNSELGNRLLERKKEGLCLRVRHATPFDLGSFQPERLNGNYQQIQELWIRTLNCD